MKARQKKVKLFLKLVALRDVIEINSSIEKSFL